METKHHCTIHQGEGTFDLLPGQRCKKCRPKENKEECRCEEMTCKEDCTRNHTHETFWCEKCHPEVSLVQVQEVTTNVSQTPDSMDWEKEFDVKISSPDYNGGFLSNGCEECGSYPAWGEVRDFIRKHLTLAHSSGRREIEQKLNELYTELENDNPPLTWNRYEQEYNAGFKTGRLNAMERVVVKLTGKNGDELKSLLDKDPT